MIKLWLLVVEIPIWAGMAFSETKGSTVAALSWKEHLDLVQIVFAGLFGLVSYLLIRTLNKIDRNQGLMFERLVSLEKEFNTLKGEHNALKSFHEGGGEKGIACRRKEWET